MKNIVLWNINLKSSSHCCKVFFVVANLSGQSIEVSMEAIGKNIAVIGAGLSGLVCAWFIKDVNPEARVTIFEGAQKGGQISTLISENLTIERGPAFLPLENPILHYITSKTGSRDLTKIKETQFYIVKDTYYQKSPAGFMQFENGALSFLSGGFQALLGMKKKIPVWENLTFFDFLKAAYGQSYAETMGSNFSRANYFCEAEDLNLQAAFPALYEELKLGNNLKDTFQNLSIRKQKFWEEFNLNSNPKFEPGFYFFNGGLGKLVDLIYDDLKQKNVHFEFSKISEIERQKEKYYLHTKHHKSDPFDKIILSASASDQSHFWKTLSKDISLQLGILRHRPVSYVYSAYNMKEFNRAGLGFMAPRKEKLTISGAYYINAYDLEPAKAGKFLTRTIIPGDLSLFNDDEVIEIQKRDFEKVFGLKSQPMWSNVYRHVYARPVLDKGYLEWKNSLYNSLKEYQGIQMIGKDFSGGDVNLVLENALKAAKSVC